MFLLAIQHKNAPDLPIYAEVIPKWRKFSTRMMRAETVSKEEWIGSKNIELDYIYATVSGKDLIPFGHIRLRTLVSPLIP